MSFPTIPNVSVTITLTAEEVVNLLLSSIAFEELGLAHLINSEAEKIQFVLGTLPGQTTSAPPSFESLISIDETVERMLKLITKEQMLLEFKLEETAKISTSSTTTVTTTTATTTTTTSIITTTTVSTTTTTTTTTSTTTTTATVTTACAPGLTFAVFSNRNFSIASESVINVGTQVNGNMIITHSGNNFLGETNVVGTFTDTSMDNLFEQLNVGAPSVLFKTFDASCLMSNATIIINGDVNISSHDDAAIFQGNTVWVNGDVSITGGNISITGGGILATGSITVSGGSFTYTSTGCFALYSQTGAININNGPYSIKGLIYTASTTGAGIHLATSQGGAVCGAVISGTDVEFTGGSAVHQISNQGICSPCLLCNELCPG